MENRLSENVQTQLDELQGIVNSIRDAGLTDSQIALLLKMYCDLKVDEAIGIYHQNLIQSGVLSASTDEDKPWWKVL